MGPKKKGGKKGKAVPLGTSTPIKKKPPSDEPDEGEEKRIESKKEKQKTKDTSKVPPSVPESDVEKDIFVSPEPSLDERGAFHPSRTVVPTTNIPPQEQVKEKPPSDEPNKVEEKRIEPDKEKKKNIESKDTSKALSDDNEVELSSVDLGEPPPQPKPDEEKGIFLSPEPSLDERSAFHPSRTVVPTTKTPQELDEESSRASSYPSVSEAESEKPRPIRFPYHTYWFLPFIMFQRIALIGNRVIASEYVVAEMGYTTEGARLFFSSLNIVISLISLGAAYIQDGISGTFMPLVVALLSILTSNILFTLGAMELISFSSAWIIYIGLIFYAIGIGITRPIVFIFSLDQFTLPEQSTEVYRFLFAYFFIMQAGNFLAIAFLPYATTAISCLGRQYCYSFTFGIIGVFEAFYIGFFFILIRYFRLRGKPAENYPKKAFSIIVHSINVKLTAGLEGKEYWLDNAREKYGEENVYRTKKLLRLIAVFVSCSGCFCLEQQHVPLFRDFSRNMEGSLFACFQLLSSQIGLFSSMMSIVLIPVVMRFISPALNYDVLKRIVAGSISVFFAYIIFYFLTRVVDYVDDHYIPDGFAKLRLYNPTSCDFVIQAPEVQIENITVLSMECTTIDDVYWDDDIEYDYKLVTLNCPDSYPKFGHFELHNTEVTGYYFRLGKLVKINDTEERLPTGHPMLRFVTEPVAKIKMITARRQQSVIEIPTNEYFQTKNLIPPGGYTFNNGHFTCLKKGAIITFMVHISHEAKVYIAECIVREPRAVSVWWLFPVCTLTALARVTIYPAMWELCYIYGPTGLKAITSASFLLFSESGGHIWIIVLQYFVQDFTYLAVLCIVLIIFAIVITVMFMSHLTLTKETEVVVWNYRSKYRR